MSNASSDVTWGPPSEKQPQTGGILFFRRKKPSQHTRQWASNLIMESYPSCQDQGKINLRCHPEQRVPITMKPVSAMEDANIRSQGRKRLVSCPFLSSTVSGNFLVPTAFEDEQTGDTCSIVLSPKPDEVEQREMNAILRNKESRQAHQQKLYLTENNPPLCEKQRNMNPTSCEDTCQVLSQCHLKQPTSTAENARKPRRGHNRLSGCSSYTAEVVSNDSLLDISDDYNKYNSESHPRENGIEECGTHATPGKRKSRISRQRCEELEDMNLQSCKDVFEDVRCHPRQEVTIMGAPSSDTTENAHIRNNVRKLTTTAKTECVRTALQPRQIFSPRGRHLLPSLRSYHWGNSPAFGVSGRRCLRFHIMRHRLTSRCTTITVRQSHQTHLKYPLKRRRLALNVAPVK